MPSSTDRPTPTDARSASDESATARPTVAVVLGSGGARGYAHIGVLQVLEEIGLDVVGIAGASMGALVGGLHAAGALDEYTEWAMGLGRFEILRLMDLSLARPSAFSADKAFGVVGDILGDRAIEDLPIPFTAVAVDLVSQREVWFQRGPLETAIRASSAIPSFFAPVVHHGRVLVDGGVLNPVPVAPLASTHADHVVAVTLNGPDEPAGPPLSASAEPDDDGEWSTRVRDTAARWFDTDLLAAVRRRLSPEVEEAVRARLAGTPPEADAARRPARSSQDESPSTLGVLQGALEIMQASITRHRLAGYPPDLVVSVPKSACSTLDFHRAEEMIDLGRRLSRDALDRLVDPESTAGDGF